MGPRGREEAGNRFGAGEATPAPPASSSPEAMPGVGVRRCPGTRGSPVASLPAVFTGCARVSASCAGVAGSGTATLVSVIRVSHWLGTGAPRLLCGG